MHPAVAILYGVILVSMLWTCAFGGWLHWLVVPVILAMSLGLIKVIGGLK